MNKIIRFDRIMIQKLLIVSCTLANTFLPSFFSKIVLWGSFLICFLYIGYDVLIVKNINKTKFIFLPCLFVVASLIATIISFLNNKNMGYFIDNLQISSSYLIWFFFLCVTDFRKKKAEMFEDFLKLCRFIIGFFSIPLIMGSLQGIFNIKIPLSFYHSLNFEEGYYIIGWYGRYYTIFKNPNGLAMLCVCVLAAILICLSVENNKRVNIIYKGLIIPTIITMCLCASRGAMLACAVAIVFHYITTIKNYKNYKNILLNLFSGLFFAVIFVGVMYYTPNVIPNIVPNIESKSEFLISKIINLGNEDSGTILNDKITKKEAIIIRDYEEHGDDISNHRFTLWSMAAKAIPKSPIYGYSSYSDDSFVCHNMYLSIMIFYGILGFIPFMLFLICCGMYGLKNELSRKLPIQEHKVLHILLLFWVVVLVYALTSDPLINAYDTLGVVSWIFMGYIISPLFNLIHKLPITE